MEVRSIEKIIRALNDGGVRYIIVGGVAVVAHGYERFTRDLDLVIELEKENIFRAMKILQEIGYHPRLPITPEQFSDPALRAKWRLEKNMVVLPLWSDKHERTPVDIFVHEPFDFAKEFVLMVRQPVLGADSAPIVSYQTLIQLKKSAGRAQDLADVENLEKIAILRKQI